jgi:hypothetical protein
MIILKGVDPRMIANDLTPSKVTLVTFKRQSVDVI